MKLNIEEEQASDEGTLRLNSGMIDDIIYGEEPKKKAKI